MIELIKKRERHVEKRRTLYGRLWNLSHHDLVVSASFSSSSRQEQHYICVGSGVVSCKCIDIPTEHVPLPRILYTMLPVATVCKQNLEDISRTDHASMLEISGTELVEGSGGGADPGSKSVQVQEKRGCEDECRFGSYETKSR